MKWAPLRTDGTLCRNALPRPRPPKSEDRREVAQALQPSDEWLVFEQESDQPSELPCVLWGGVELVLELQKSASSLELSSSSCYSFAGLRLQPLLDRVPFHFQLDCRTPVEHRQQPPPPRQRGEEYLLAAVVGGKFRPRGW